MILIRPYDESDFDMICSWWKAHEEVGPIPGMMIKDGTFVLEYESLPVMTMTVYTTQTLEVAFFEGFCSRPDVDGDLRKSLGKQLWEHCYQYLRDKGFKRVIAYTNHWKLAKRYMDLGMKANIGGLISLGKEL
jgi:hypothetical protein